MTLDLVDIYIVTALTQEGSYCSAMRMRLPHSHVVRQEEDVYCMIWDQCDPRKTGSVDLGNGREEKKKKIHRELGNDVITLGIFSSLGILISTAASDANAS